MTQTDVAARIELTYQRPMRIVVCVLFAAVMLAGDLWLKYWSFDTVGQGGRPDEMVLVESVLSLKLTINEGAVFGIGQGKGWMFIIFAMVALWAIAYMFLQSPARHTLFHISLALICAGALGNLYDRTIHSGVRDMLWLFPHVKLPFGWRWPMSNSDGLYPWIFNLADVYLLVGICLILLNQVFGVGGRHQIAAGRDPSANVDRA